MMIRFLTLDMSNVGQADLGGFRQIDLVKRCRSSQFMIYVIVLLRGALVPFESLPKAWLSRDILFVRAALISNFPPVVPEIDFCNPVLRCFAQSLVGYNHLGKLPVLLYVNNLSRQLDG